MIGLKVSKEGFDVRDTEDENLIFSTEFDTLRVAEYGSGSITTTLGSAQTVTINHLLGYRPAFLVFSEIYDVFTADTSAGHFLMPYTDPVGGDGSIIPYVSSTQLKIRYGAVHAPNGIDLNYRYYIFYNPSLEA